jgi:hypothetical protein
VQAGKPWHFEETYEDLVKLGALVEEQVGWRCVVVATLLLHIQPTERP